MKKLLVLFVAALTLTGCNKNLFDTKYSFDKVHIVSTSQCYEIKSWTDYDQSDMIQVVLNDKDGTVILGHSAEMLLIKGKCPLCNK